MNSKEYRASIYLYLEIKYGEMEQRTKSELSKMLHKYGQLINACYKEQIEVLAADNKKLRQTITKLTNK